MDALDRIGMRQKVEASCLMQSFQSQHTVVMATTSQSKIDNNYLNQTEFLV